MHSRQAAACIFIISLRFHLVYMQIGHNHPRNGRARASRPAVAAAPSSTLDTIVLSRSSAYTLCVSVNIHCLTKYNNTIIYTRARTHIGFIFFTIFPFPFSLFLSLYRTAFRFTYFIPPEIIIEFPAAASSVNDAATRSSARLVHHAFKSLLLLLLLSSYCHYNDIHAYSRWYTRVSHATDVCYKNK